VHLQSIHDSSLVRVLNSPWSRTFLQDISRQKATGFRSGEWLGRREGRRKSGNRFYDWSLYHRAGRRTTEVELFSAVTAINYLWPVASFRQWLPIWLAVSTNSHRILLLVPLARPPITRTSASLSSSNAPSGDWSPLKWLLPFSCSSEMSIEFSGARKIAKNRDVYLKIFLLDSWFLYIDVIMFSFLLRWLL